MSLDYPVIRTKTIIPRRRSEILSRPRLLSILDNVLDLKLLILAAPAGYGKTSLLVDFAYHTQVPVCWLALDPLDSDPKRFIAHFITSIQTRYKSFGSASFAALNELNQDNLNLDPVISAIVNDAYEQISEHFIIVLDDYHLVRDCKPIEQFINRFIQDMAENCHIIIASRTLLTLPDMTLLVARSQVEGLSFEELAFLPEEIKQLMSMNYHQSISDSYSEELITRTEGWITGLLLTAQLSPKNAQERKRLEKVSGVGIYEYLTQQVFNRQHEEMQLFLLRTSLLEEFDTSLCEKIIGKALDLANQNWSSILDTIQRDNLFVLSVGEDTLFLRYHHLFRDFLQNRMRLERPDETLKIENHLAQYFAANHEWERAADILFRIGTENQLVDLILSAAPTMILGGRLVTLTEWLDALPKNLSDLNPNLMSIRGTIYALRGDTKKSLALLTSAIKGLRNKGEMIELTQTLIRRSSVYRYLGKYESAMSDAEEAIDLVKDNDNNRHLHAEALRTVGLILYQRGQLKESQDTLLVSHRYFTEIEMVSDAAKVLMELGVVNSSLGELDKAEKSYSDSLAYWQQVRNSLWLSNVMNNLGVLQEKRGQYEQAIVTLEGALSYARLAVNPRLEAYILASLGDLYQDLQALVESRQAYDKALEILQGTEDLSLYVSILLAIASLERINGNFELASKNILKAVKSSDKEGSDFDRNRCLMEKCALMVKRGQYIESVKGLLDLKDYFSKAGFQIEFIKSSFYISMIELLNPEKNAPSALDTLLKQHPDGTARETLYRVGFEYRQAISSKINSGAEKTPSSIFCEELGEFEQKLPRLHRTIRRHSSAVQFSTPKLIIRGFGKSQVKLGDRIISISDWKSQVVRELFYYLLSHPEGVTKEDIGEAFWPDATPDTLKLRFKNTIYRMRKAIGSECVTFVDEYYRFDRSIDFEYDVDSFLQELEAARESQDREQQIQHLRLGISNYRGDLLPKFDQEWVLILREQYRKRFLAAVIDLINLYIQDEKFTLAEQLTERALEEDSCNEIIHRAAMLVYSGLNDRSGIARQYERCRTNMMKELETEPSQQTNNLYSTLMRQ